MNAGNGSSFPLSGKCSNAAARQPWVCAIRLPRLFGGRRHQPFEVTFEIGIIDLGEIAAFERIGPSFDFGAEGFEPDSVSYSHG
jgi:hypothetical protein